jgi:hypothetical protein
MVTLMKLMPMPSHLKTLLLPQLFLDGLFSLVAQELGLQLWELSAVALSACSLNL